MKTEILYEVLNVHRERKTHLNCITTLKDSKGLVKAIISGYNQPKKSKNAKIILRGKTYNLNFIN